MFESFWKTICYFFSWFKRPKYMSVNNSLDDFDDIDDIEYGKLPDNININTKNDKAF